MQILPWSFLVYNLWPLNFTPFGGSGKIMVPVRKLIHVFWDLELTSWRESLQDKQKVLGCRRLGNKAAQPSVIISFRHQHPTLIFFKLVENEASLCEAWKRCPAHSTGGLFIGLQSL